MLYWNSLLFWLLIEEVWILSFAFVIVLCNQTLRSFFENLRCTEFNANVYGFVIPQNSNTFSEQVKSSLFSQGSPISHRLVSEGVLCKIKTT